VVSSVNCCGLFSYLADVNLCYLCGKFYIQFNIPAGVTGTATLKEVEPFNAGNNTVITVQNNDAVNSYRSMVEIEGCFESAVIVVQVLRLKLHL